METFATRPRSVALAIALLGTSLIFPNVAVAQHPQSGEQLPVPGRPVPADYSKLSEHNIEWLQTQSPQVQAEFLLQAAVNRQKGATDLIEKWADGWQGKLQDTPRWEALQDSAFNSSDLRVRAAAIEIHLAVRNLAKTDDTVSALIQSSEKASGNRPYAAWELGMLANRGVQQQRTHELLARWIHDSNEQTRFWAVEGLAHIGSDETIKNLLDVLRNDASLNVRERAGCSLAKSGMLTREQRMKAVPGLLELTDDPSLDATTRGWIYQALCEIADVSLPNDPATWRNWYASHGAERVQQFRAAGPSALGNN